MSSAKARAVPSDVVPALVLHDFELFGPMRRDLPHALSHARVINGAEFFNNPVRTVVECARVLRFKELQEALGALASPELDTTVLRSEEHTSELQSRENLV